MKLQLKIKILCLDCRAIANCMHLLRFGYNSIDLNLFLSLFSVYVKVVLLLKPKVKLKILQKPHRHKYYRNHTHTEILGSMHL